MASHDVETLRWKDEALELIDQRILPRHIEYVRCQSASEVAIAITTMVVRGAPAIGCAAAYGIALAAREAAARGCPLISALERAYELLVRAKRGQAPVS